jgi:hypothetical protein
MEAPTLVEDAIAFIPPIYSRLRLTTIMLPVPISELFTYALVPHAWLEVGGTLFLYTRKHQSHVVARKLFVLHKYR